MFHHVSFIRVSATVAEVPVYEGGDSRSVRLPVSAEERLEVFEDGHVLTQRIHGTNVKREVEVSQWHG